MKIKEKKELRLKSLRELKNLASEAKDALDDLKIENTQNKLKNTSQLSLKRREIAQILTIIREKELFEQQTKK